MENNMKTFEVTPLGGATVGLGDYYGNGGGLGFAGKMAKVVDEFDTPMAFVNVYVKDNPSTGNTTNSDGMVDISFAGEGQEVVFSFMGYGTIVIPFEKITDGQTIRMEMTTEELPEVVITKPGNTNTTASLPKVVDETKKINWIKIAGIGLAAMALIAILSSGSKKPRKVNA